ncbi:nicotinate-nucleotide adenylyltransferase [Alteribacter populi]|uniref:nicotinate-nucleotide adenylyltransferase n=1 Tax=Alteribacter populi TaxID=2011011 RepID=UPI000BBA4179|nr:nicotinate-nucleotide adenylyltransferase [Alteribacter populi]
MNKRIGILGGTFDPPHIGHAILAEEARINLGLDLIWWIPNRIPPHKKKMSQTTNTDRWEMVRRLCQGHPNFELNTIELEREGPSYTVDTIKKLKHNHPETSLFFILGGDSIDTLAEWKNIEEISEMVTFVGMKRPGYQAKTELDIMIHLLDSPKINVSSTLIREKIKTRTLNSFLLPKEVASYIKERHLYE